MKQAITDLERGKFLPGGTYESSTVRIAQSISPAEAGAFNYRLKYFERSGSNDQRVAGSLGSPFNFEVPFSVRTYVRRIDFVIASVNIITFLDYGLIDGGLPNGVQLLRSDGVTETQIFNVKRWLEFGHFVDDQLGQISFMENPSEGILIASLTLEPLWFFDAGSKLIVRIRDDLSSLRYHRSSVLLLEET